MKTTMKKNKRRRGAAAVEVLLAEIADPGRARTVVRTPARLIMRNSTATPPLGAPAG